MTLTPDVAAEVARLRKEEGLGVSDAMIALARRGMAASGPAARPFRQRTAALGARVDVSDIGAVLDLLDDA